MTEPQSPLESICTESATDLPLLFHFAEEAQNASREAGAESEFWTEAYKMTDTD